MANRNAVVKNDDLTQLSADATANEEEDSYRTESEEAWQLMVPILPDSTQSQLIDYKGFRVSFNPEYKLPNWVAWELTGDEAVATKANRKYSVFLTDENVEGCGSTYDYSYSSFDRGHMCPAGDMKWDQEAMNDCFMLTNICPQANALNGGAWNTLENKCRYWAQRDSALVIICGPVLTDKLTRTIGENEIPVPERFYKVVIAPFAKPVRAIGFVMPNCRVDGGMQTTAMSIDEVEAITGLDFFSILPDDIEDKIEAECNLPLWNKHFRY